MYRQVTVLINLEPKITAICKKNIKLKLQIPICTIAMIYYLYTYIRAKAIELELYILSV